MFTRIAKKYFSSTTPKNLLKGHENPISLKIAEKRMINSDSLLLTLKFPEPDQQLGVPCANHVHLRFYDEQGQLIKRPYTPISHPNKEGSVEFLVKVYEPTAAYPNGGQVSGRIQELKVGEYLEIGGPVGKIQIDPMTGALFYQQKPKIHQKLTMIAGGSGITPHYSYLISMAEMPFFENFQYDLLYFNKTEEDIWLKSELEALNNEYDNINVQFTLETARDDWEGFIGMPTIENLDQQMEVADAGNLVWICGTPAMNMQSRLNLEAMGFSGSMIIP